MKTIIILISVDHDNARAVCNVIENKTYASFTELEEALKAFRITNKLIFNISDFMEAVNDQELYVLTEYFISYVKIEK